MHICNVYIRNFRNFLDCEIPLNKGLSVIIGENNIGKTNFLAALSLILSPDASNRTRQLERDDFCLDIPQSDEPPEISISCTLTDFQTDSEKSTVATWFMQHPQEARITYVFRCKAKAKEIYKQGAPYPIDDYEWVIYGGETESRERFEHEQLQKISLELLEALRDAERDLEPSARGNVSRLINNFQSSERDRENITTAVQELNDDLSKTTQIEGAQSAINTRLKEIIGETSAQEARLSPVGANYDELIRNVRVEIRSTGEEYRRVNWNGLGYNNLLFVSVLLAEYLEKQQKHKVVLPVMAIEEPEAHLHPHLQKVLNRNFEQTVRGAQVIATTHSTHITSSVTLDALVVLNREEKSSLQAIRVGDLFKNGKEDERHQKDLERYLDATKSTLFFAKSVLLVEGIAEALLIPVLAQKCAREKFNLDEDGISVVAVHGLAFRPFLKLFGPEAIRRKCAVLTDSDTKQFPLDPAGLQLGATAAGLIRDFGGDNNPFISIFPNLETLEFDLAVATSAENMADPQAPISNEEYILRALKNTPKVTQKNIPAKGSISNRDEFGKRVLELIEKTKGRFAQSLAAEIDENFIIPNYIQDAFDFLCGVQQ